MKNNFKFEIKAIILLIALLLIVVVIGVLTYNRFTSIVNSISENSRPDLKLLSTKSLQGHLKQLENNAKTFSLTQDSVYVKLFESSEKKVYSDIKYLNNFQKSKNLDIVQLDSLIQIKVGILKTLLYSQDQFRVKEAIGKIESVTDEVSTEITKTESEQEEEKSFKLFPWKRKKEQEEAALLKERENEKELYRLSTQIREIKKEELSLEEQLKHQELELITADNKISILINQIFDNFEERELIRIDNAIHEIQVNASSTNKQIALVCFILCVFILFMFYLIINYVKKSNRYGKALKDSKREAEKLAEARQKFVANMSHEIRTPMNAIVGFAEQMRTDNLRQEQKQQLTTIRKSADHLLYLINEILDFSKLENKKLKLENINFNPKTIVYEVEELFSQSTKEKNIELKIEIEKNCPDAIIGDPFRLRQILLNLVSNAIKFTDKGFVSIQLSSTKINNQHHLKFTIKDTGIGMESSFLNNIFKEFEQESSSTSRNYGGTGLGLSITKHLIELHHGTINVDSSPGEGSVFTIEIPYQEGNENELSDTDLSKLNLNPLKDKKCLVVDDEPYNRLLLKTILTKNGATFKEANDGLQAIEWVNKEDFDIVFMDARMPNLNGIEASKQIRSNKKNEKLKIIAISAATEKEDKKAFLSAGMNGIIMKPFKEKDLFKEIFKVFGFEIMASEETASLAINNSTNMEKVHFDELRIMSNGDNQFYIDMLETFISTTTTGLKQLNEAYKDNNRDVIAEIAHKIASPCNHLGISEMYSELKSIENESRANELNGEIKEKLIKIEQEFEVVKDIISSEIKKIKS